MRAIAGSAHSRYAGLLPIEPSDEFFRPIDLKPEDVPFSHGRPSDRKRPRAFARLLVAFCTGVAATLLWQSYGDAAREMVANLYPQLSWFGPRPALTPQNPHTPDVTGPVVPAAPSAEKLNATSFDLDAVGQNKIATTIAAGGAHTTRSADQVATLQEQTRRNTDQTAASVDQAPAAKVNGMTVESRADGASSQPIVHLDIKPTEALQAQTLAEKGKPLASCFASASAVLQNQPGGWPTWTLKAPGHEGTMCWYAAARPRGSDHRRVGTTEKGLSSPPAPRPHGWDLGLP